MARLAPRGAYPSQSDLNLPEIQDLPGSTVDALLDKGDLEGAQAEFERLCLEGLDSGDPIEMTSKVWEDLLRGDQQAKFAS